ncbi:hypothetical protein [Parasphingorhabdus sp.]|uniref:hypothetical protein n=1 Tax=Parasphingorhabdus sp. TaxID=2709688 RepID=UPI003A8E2D20
MKVASKLSEFELDLIKTVKEIADSHVSASSSWSSPAALGWTTSGSVRSVLGSKSLPTRETLRRLAARGFIDLDVQGQVQYFRTNLKSTDALLGVFDAVDSADGFTETSGIDSKSWTGVVSPVQVQQVLIILSEIEDVCESMTENLPRAQVMGLVRALEILLDLPNPPRTGVLALVRDPAFANVIQVATLLAAITAALKG